MNVLVADDSPTNRCLVKALLESEKHSTLEARDGVEALALLGRPDGPDVAVMDWEMPGMDGVEVCRRLRAQSKKFVYLIVLTVRESTEDAVAALDAGADDFVRKPFDVKELLARVRIGIRMVEVQRSLEQRIVELHGLNQDLDAFNRSVTHDLKTPINGIQGMAELLREDWEAKLDDTGKEYLRHICETTDRMRHIVDDLLQLSQAGRKPLNVGKTNLSRIAEEVLSELGRHDSGHVREISVRDALVVEADEGLMKIALENLLRNAWKFSAKRETPRIEFGMRASERGEAFFVKDNGAGFDMKYASRLFSPFERLHSEQEFTGTGVGLSIVQRIISRHGGTLWAESVPNNGATFYFQLQGMVSDAVAVS